jgi:drug/metabolite transporter (DMT)-like permease
MLQKPKNPSVLFVVLAALIWSTSFALTKVLLSSVPPLTIGAIRFTIAALVLAGLTRAQKNWRRPSRKTVTSMSIAGFLGVFLYFTLENFGVQYATASDATIIVASYPIITLIAEILLKRASFNLLKLVGMVIAIIGVWMVVEHGAAMETTNRPFGVLLLFLGGVVWTAYNLISSGLKHNETPLTTTYYQTVAGSIGFIFAASLETRQWQPLSVIDILILGYLAIACSVSAFLFYNAGLRKLSSASAVNILNLVPVFGMVWAVVLAGETVTFIQIVGGLTVILGVFLGSVKGDAVESSS